MTVKFAVFLFMMFGTFSTESENELDPLLPLIQQLKPEELLEQRAKGLQQQEETLRKRERRLKVAEERLKTREQIVQQREQSLNALTQMLQKDADKLYAQKESLTERSLFVQESLRQSNSLLQIAMRKSAGPLMLNLYPNDSSIQVFRDVQTNEIYWEDKKNLICNKIKEKIEFALQQKGETMSNNLFDCISNWNPSTEAEPFVKELMLPLSENVDVGKRTEGTNFTPLMFAARFDAEEAVVKLIDRGANMKIKDVDGYTALYWAAAKGGRAACKVLLRKGANVNAQNKNGTTPLMFAAEYGYVEIVRFLLQSGANAKIENKNKKTALAVAKRNCAVILREHEAENSKLSNNTKI